jgi:hypothetical protein
VAEMVRSLGDQDPEVRYFGRLQQDHAFRDQRLAAIEHPEARAYFQRLVADEAMQAEIASYWAEKVVPAEQANWAAFRRAYGERLQLVELDVPSISGYEYRTAPGLVEPHIRRFLDGVGARRESL